MHSSFATTLNNVKNMDGTLAKTLNHSNTINNPTSFGLCAGKSVKTPSRCSGSRKHQNFDGRENTSILNASHSRKLSSSAIQRSMSVESDADRFIPNRQAIDIEKAQFVLSQSSIVTDSTGEPGTTDNKPEDRILEYRVKRPNPPMHEINAHNNDDARLPTRVICSKPDRILDAPNIKDDFYLNIIDWSTDSEVAVGLESEVYIWNANSGSIKLLMSAGLDQEYITSLRFSPQDANILAIGTCFGRIQLWDVADGSLQRTMITGEGTTGRIPVLAWRDHLVSSAARSGEIRQHDIRVANHEVGYCKIHDQGVCGLQWSPDNRYLASGGNDNLVCVFSASEVMRLSGVRPEHMLTDHCAAVKALAWCPWKPNLLCTGGGTADHNLFFWNTLNGSRVKAVDVKRQVTGLIWNQEYRELATSHDNGVISLWKYPSISKIKDIAGHRQRIICMINSPNGEIVATISADETLRIWNMFDVDHAKKRQVEKEQMPIFSLPRPIR